jgi:hypothetical protein
VDDPGAEHLQTFADEGGQAGLALGGDEIAVDVRARRAERRHSCRQRR